MLARFFGSIKTKKADPNPKGNSIPKIRNDHGLEVMRPVFRRAFWNMDYWLNAYKKDFINPVQTNERSKLSEYGIVVFVLK